MGDHWETNVNSCGPRHPEWEARVGDKWETSGRHVGDKWEKGVNSYGPKHPEWETSVGEV